MLTLLILATGLVIVIGGILGLRLHAFAALILAGITVAVLTPSTLVTRSGQLEATIKKVVIDREAKLVLTADGLDDTLEFLIAIDAEDGKALTPAGKLMEEVPLTSWKLERPYQKPSCYRFDFDDDAPANAAESRLVILSQSDFAAAKSLGGQSFMKRLTTALGSYCGNLAILIVAASIIGRCLLDSGAADCIVKSALHTVGEKNASAAFVVSGFTLSIPVFFDTVFYLMIPLGKALRRRTGGNYLLYVLSIVAGGSMAHSLVPPTPGPLFIAEAFGVSIAAMIVGGCLVGMFGASVGMLYAFWANRNFELPLPEDDEVTTAAPATALPVNPDDNSGPGLFVSLVPILLPVLLITLGALVTEIKSDIAGDPSQWTFAGMSVSKSTAKIFTVAGEKNFALLVSAIFAAVLYVRIRRPSKEAFATAMQDAVSSAGTIILVTAAGGAFGRMMRQTSVAELLQDLPGTSPIMVVVAAFLVTMAVRTAQGSSTVAMITAAGIFGGLVASGEAGVDPLYVALAVGCGSKPIAWMNDSGFWVITRMSGMTEKEGLKYITPMTAIAGFAGLGAVILGVVLFP